MNIFKKALQFAAQLLVLLAMIYAILWITEALGNLMITLLQW